MTSCRTAGVDETRALGAAVAGVLRGGDVVLLAGDLGAGKTAFTQGLARALGVTEQVTSPTFTLARSYTGRLVLHHLDVYRLEHLQEAEDLGLGELIDDGGVTVIEWGDAVAPVLPSEYLEIRIAFPPDGDDDARTLALRPVGGAWSARARALAEAVEAWAC